MFCVCADVFLKHHMPLRALGGGYMLVKRAIYFLLSLKRRRHEEGIYGQIESSYPFHVCGRATYKLSNKTPLVANLDSFFPQIGIFIVSGEGCSHLNGAQQRDNH